MGYLLHEVVRTDSLMGNSLSKKVQPMICQDQVLTIASLSSMATEILQKKEKVIIEKINEQFGDNSIRKISYLT